MTNRTACPITIYLHNPNQIFFGILFDFGIYYVNYLKTMMEGDENLHELYNFETGLLKSDHKRIAYQEGREISCKFLCFDGVVMVINTSSIHS